MFLKLWNYLRGYVIIEVSGFSVERFINLAVHRGIFIWDVSRDSEVATMKVSIEGFKLLKPCAKKTKCKVKIASRVGTPFKVYKYRKRKIFAFGALLFIFILYFLSSFIWLVEVQGTKRMEKYSVVNYLAENKLKPGSFKIKLNEKELEKLLLSNFEDISWVNISIKGTKATVFITESIKKQEVLDKSQPCDIIAKKDGIISSIATSSGTPKVKPGDVVKKGDVLVSSELIVGTDESNFKSQYVHAQSEVRGKVYNKIEFDIPFSYIVKNYTGKTIKEYSIITFDKNVHTLKRKIDFGQFDVSTTRTQLNLGENYPLPVIIVCDEYKEFIPENNRYSEAEAEEVAERILNQKIISSFDFETDIMDNSTEYTVTQNSLKVQSLVVTNEIIGEKVTREIPDSVEE